MKFHGQARGLSTLMICLLLAACNLSDVVMSRNDFPDTMTKVQQELAKKGYKSTIFEALPVPGGMLRVGVPGGVRPRGRLALPADHLARGDAAVRYGQAGPAV